MSLPPPSAVDPVLREQHLRLLQTLPAPEPVPDAAAYQAEREAALAADPRRRANYERYLATRRTSAAPDYLPIKLDIENVSRCNFRCTMCVVSGWDKGRRAGDMTVESFKALLEEQYGVVEIKLQGIGEPLLGREALFEMIRHARASRIWVRTATNASLLHRGDTYRKLIDSGVNEVQISIDGASKETFETIRRNSSFGRVVDNCRLINGYCRDLGIERTKMWCCVQRANFHELERLVDLGHEIGFKHLVLAVNLGGWAIETWQQHNESISVDYALDIERARNLMRMGDERGMKVRFWCNSDKYSLKSRDTLCPWLFERAFISSDIRLVPCCFVGNPDLLQIGPPLESGRGVATIWQSVEYAVFRQAHLDGNLPQICKGCYGE